MAQHVLKAYFMRALLGLFLVAGCMGCMGGGAREAQRKTLSSPLVGESSSRTSVTAAPRVVLRPAPSAKPAADDGVEVSIATRRVGQAYFVKVKARVADQRENSDFERSSSWKIRAVSNGETLQRLVNGSTRVERDLLSRGRWNITVEFDATFRLPSEDAEVQVWVAPPAGDYQRPRLASL